MTEAQKATALENLKANATTLVESFLKGTMPRAIGTAGSSGAADDDVVDQLDAAKAKMRQLEADRVALEEALVVMGINRLMPDAHYNANAVRNAVRAKLAEAERAAAASVNPADSVNKATVKAKLDEAIRLAEGLSTTTLSNTVTGKDTLVAKLGEISPLVS